MQWETNTTPKAPHHVAQFRDYAQQPASSGRSARRSAAQASAALRAHNGAIWGRHTENPGLAGNAVIATANHAPNPKEIIKMAEFEGRNAASASGSFIAVPSAYPMADPGIIQSLKLEFTVGRSASGKIRPEYSTNVALIDFDAVDPNTIDAKKIAADCDLLKEIASKYPDELKQIISELKLGTEEAVDRGLTVAKRIGLTEENAISRGGGLFVTIVVIGGGLLLGSCGGALREKVTSPAATTTPNPPPPRDAGTGDN